MLKKQILPLVITPDAVILNIIYDFWEFTFNAGEKPWWAQASKTYAEVGVFLAFFDQFSTCLKSHMYNADPVLPIMSFNADYKLKASEVLKRGIDRKIDYKPAQFARKVIVVNCVIWTLRCQKNSLILMQDP